MPSTTTNRYKGVLLIAGAILAYNAFAKSTAAGNILFYPDNIHSVDIGGSGLILTAKIRVQNTSGQKFVIRSFAGNVFDNGSLVGNAENFQTVEVNPNSQILYPITIRIGWFGIADKIIEAWSSNGIGVKMDIKGSVNAENQQVKVALTYGLNI